ncbi:MAG: hypothetical protein ACPL07_02100 [Candidatus Bathyarchaeia archaeon]
MPGFFLDEKYWNFLLLAEKDDVGARAYAFKYNGKIVYVEDIPVNYPRITVCTRRGLKSVVKTLKRHGWNIVIDRSSE